MPMRFFGGGFRHKKTHQNGEEEKSSLVPRRRTTNEKCPGSGTWCGEINASGAEKGKKSKTRLLAES